MRASARVAWRVAAAVAFAATAALAVTLTRGAPLQTALTSARNTGHSGAAAVAHQHRHRHWQGLACRTSGLRIWVDDGDGGTLRARVAAVEFTNTSGAACTMNGYPQVTASRGDGAQVGNAASRDTSMSVRRIMLTPGATAHAVLADDISGFPGGSCKPVTAVGLRVVPPGTSIAHYVWHAITACSVAGLRKPVFLHVRALQAGIGAA